MRASGARARKPRNERDEAELLWGAEEGLGMREDSCGEGRRAWG